MGIHQDFLNSKGPSDQNRGPGVEMGEQFADILRPPARMVPVTHLLGLALPTRIERNDSVRFREMLDLGLPDLRRHGPSWHEHEGRTGSCLQIMEFDPVAGREVVTLDLHLSKSGLGTCQEEESEKHRWPQRTP
jgi:hypothetical protein